MDELVAFLRAALDRDEQVAERNSGDRGLGDDGSFPDYRTYGGEDLAAADEFLAHFNPKRMLAEVKAKRRLIDEAIRLESYDGEFQFLEMLAQPYAGQPGWRDEWRAEPDVDTA